MPTVQLESRETTPQRRVRKRGHFNADCSFRPRLRFTPTAWAKLLYLRDVGDTEVGGFGIAAPDDLLRIEDIALVRQQCTAVSVKFDDQAVADFFDERVDAGRQPAQFARLWLHTHPGDSAEPSMTDEDTFARCFGSTDWAVMFILAKGGATYARLQFHVGPGGSLLLPVETDFSVPFAASDHDTWDCEYAESIVVESMPFISADFIEPTWDDRGEFEDAWREYLSGDVLTDTEEAESDDRA